MLLSPIARRLWLAAAAAVAVSFPQAALAGGGSAAVPPSGANQTLHSKSANFAGRVPSADARQMADWVVATADSGGLPFMIVDKINAVAFAFDASGRLGGAAPVLLGLARGDDSPPGIGDRKLSTITPAERITPAGRFLASIGQNLGAADILWVDYAAAISMHRVIDSNRAERRPQRLASASVLDNRVSYGCINVSTAFYEGVVQPTFKEAGGLVYILPETRSLAEVFFASEVDRSAPGR